MIANLYTIQETIKIASRNVGLGSKELAAARKRQQDALEEQAQQRGKMFWCL